MATEAIGGEASCAAAPLLPLHAASPAAQTNTKQVGCRRIQSSMNLSRALMISTKTTQSSDLCRRPSIRPASPKRAGRMRGHLRRALDSGSEVFEIEHVEEVVERRAVRRNVRVGARR